MCMCQCALLAGVNLAAHISPCGKRAWLCDSLQGGHLQFFPPIPINPTNYKPIPSNLLYMHLIQTWSSAGPAETERCGWQPCLWSQAFSHQKLKLDLNVKRRLLPE